MSPILSHLLFKHDQARQNIDRVVKKDFPVGCTIGWRTAPGKPERSGTLIAYAGGCGPHRKFRVYERATEEYVEVRLTVNVRRIDG